MTIMVRKYEATVSPNSSFHDKGPLVKICKSLGIDFLWIYFTAIAIALYKLIFLNKFYSLNEIIAFHFQVQCATCLVPFKWKTFMSLKMKGACGNGFLGRV